MKPDWGSPNVPEWAAFAAQEASGAWYWHSDRPTYSEICTEWQSKGQRKIIPKVELKPQDTLEERPSEWEMEINEAVQMLHQCDPCKRVVLHLVKIQ